MSIGAVLDQLRREFPDVTLSKLRFLESEGLVSPSRTPAGYRRYDDSDVERLRYVLLAQRDQYLPLKVIRSQLESLDSGEVTALTGARSARQVVTADSFRRPRRVRLTDEEAASITKRLRALGSGRPAAPAGIDPTKARVNRAAMRGR